MRTERNVPRSTKGLGNALIVGAMLVSFSACDQLLEVEVPGNLTEDELLTPESANIIIASVIADFECSYSMMSAVNSGFEDATWSTSGYWRGETYYDGQRPGVGSCTQNTDTGTDWFTGMQKSRYVGEVAYEELQGWTTDQIPNRDVLIATAATYVGLHYQVFGEVYCEYSPGVGPLLQPMDVLAVGEDWFTRALDALGGGDAEIVSTSSLKQLALLGRARVRLGMGDHAGARADAEQIQPGFVAWVTRDASVRGRWNAVTQAFNVTRWRTIGGPLYWNDFEPDRLVSAGYRNLTISADGRQTVDDGVPDPRVATHYTGEFAQDGVTDQWVEDKYPSIGDSQHLARYAEAQLILAEIEGGQSAVNRINGLRDVHGLPHFSSNDEDEIYRTLIEERRREFFFENRHHADKLRYGLWFPRGRGKDHKGTQFNFSMCLLMPVEEYQLNPFIVESYASGYEGPDLQDLSYEFQLKLDRPVEWPVPSEL